MKENLNKYIEKIKTNHKNYRKYASIFIVLALITVVGVNGWLHQKGVSMTADYQCGKEEHQHTEDCYKEVLICGKEESTEEGGHQHTQDCYKKELVCKIPEHEHTMECISDDKADAETETDWEKTIPQKLSGVWAKDLVDVAKSQVGYQESTKNFRLDEDGKTKDGYTRYGEWYGNKYGNWSVMFAAFCLHYAGIPQKEVPVNSGCEAWMVNLKDAQLYHNADNYQPTVGDIVFLDSEEEDGVADHVGILETVKKDSKGKITSFVVVEGDSSKEVKENTYSINDRSIIGYCALPENKEQETEKTGETTEKTTKKKTTEKKSEKKTKEASTEKKIQKRTKKSVKASGDAKSTVDTCNVTVTVNLNWSGTRDKAVNVYLINQKTGERVGTVTLNKGTDSNTVTFKNVSRVDGDGKDISYGVELEKVDGYINGYNLDVSLDQTNEWKESDTLWVKATSIKEGNHYLLLTSDATGPGNSKFIRADSTITPTNMISADLALSKGPITAANGTSYSPYLKSDGGEDGALWTAEKSGAEFLFSSDYLAGKNMPGYYLESTKSLSKKNNNKWKVDKDTKEITKNGETLYPFEKVDPVYGKVRTVNMTVDATYQSKGEAEETQEYTTIRVSKNWQDEKGNKLTEGLPSSIEVTLNADGKEASIKDAKVSLSADNNWTYEWTVPRYSFENGSKKEISYDVSESEVNGFKFVNKEKKQEFGEKTTAWVLTDDFEDNGEFILTTSPKTGSVGALTATKNGAHWADGSQQKTNVEKGDLKVGDKVYKDCQYILNPSGNIIWKTGTGKEMTAHQHGTHKMWTLYNEVVNGYLKNNGQGDISSDVKQECWFYYNWYTGTPGKRPPSNPKSEWSNVLGSYNDYFLLSNNHTGDGGSTTAQTFYLYKKVEAQPVIYKIELTSKKEGEIYELPETGGPGTKMFTIIAVALMGSALLYGYYLRCRRRGREM